MTHTITFQYVTGFSTLELDNEAFEIVMKLITEATNCATAKWLTINASDGTKLIIQLAHVIDIQVG